MSETIITIKAGLDGLKTKVAGLKARAAKLTATRDDLIGQAAALEQTQTQALAELKDMGIVPKDLTPATLESLALAASTELADAIAVLEATVTEAEALVNGPATALSLE